MACCMNLRGSRIMAAAVLLVLTVAVVLTETEAAVYKVGDAAGWTTVGNVDYRQWAALKSFKLGDVIIFEYNSQFHNVMQVNHTEYRACKTTSPMAAYATGNDSITITTHGHHYFFCSVPGHCLAGQKVDINVPHIQASAATPIGAPSPTSGATNSSTVPTNGSLDPPKGFNLVISVIMVSIFAVFY